MKYLSLLILLGLTTNLAFAQKKYVDPNERQKRGLMETEDAKPVDKTADGAISSMDKTDNSKTLSAQELLCECQNLQGMNSQLDRVYWSSDEVARRAIKYKEVTGRDQDIKDTMGYIVSKNDGVDQDDCSNPKIGETNVGKLKKMIAAQEQICDVYKLRGIKR